MAAKPLRFATIEAGDGAVDHGDLDDLLSRYVRAGSDGVNRVGYAQWKAAPPDLEAL